MRYLFSILLMLVLTVPAMAVQPEEMLADPLLETRAQSLDKVIRCVQCQSENIASSNADWAKDARVMVRQLLTEGRGDQEIMSFFVERYGERVLMTPQLNGSNLILWIAGPLMLLLSFAGIFLYSRRTKPNSSDILTAEEEARLQELLKD
ncbi:cytochrome c-type biogenesis protein [Halocynthiibacter namhaensis]|uniref:cytochrome c-type biogenesis protein n=1 Tax=Halocynthiibacter namhaensis TaxID=1290553 RepID=UPI00057989A9|nr:cytochrome c-type biogenesis protein [Halocynthiibacter namhaensis]